MPLILPSFAKLNWTLEILGKRPDGYHELRTLLQTISLADELRFTEIGQGVEIVCDHPGTPADETNLAHRAAASFLSLTGLKRGVRIEIVKHIPLAAGLGGGSSNAAVTLIALQALWETRLAPRDLFALGSKLGADVPFFFIGGTCLGVGRGDEVYPVEDLRSDYLLLVNAGIRSLTGAAYRNLPPELTNPSSAGKMPLSLEAVYTDTVSRSGQPEGICSRLHNDLEAPVFALHPKLGEIKERLTRSCARGVLMSGSGSTIFAIFDSQAARSRAERDLSDTGWWCAPARTLGREEYQQIFRKKIPEHSRN